MQSNFISTVSFTLPKKKNQYYNTLIRAFIKEQNFSLFGTFKKKVIPSKMEPGRVKNEQKQKEQYNQTTYIPCEILSLFFHFTWPPSSVEGYSSDYLFSEHWSSPLRFRGS